MLRNFTNIPSSFHHKKSKSMLTQARKPLGPVCPLLEMFETQVDDKTKHAIKISSLVQQSLSTNYHKLKILPFFASKEAQTSVLLGSPWVGKLRRSCNFFSRNWARESILDLNAGNDELMTSELPSLKQIQRVST